MGRLLLMFVWVYAGESKLCESLRWNIRCWVKADLVNSEPGAVSGSSHRGCLQLTHSNQCTRCFTHFWEHFSQRFSQMIQSPTDDWTQHLYLTYRQPFCRARLCSWIEKHFEASFCFCFFHWRSQLWFDKILE